MYGLGSPPMILENGVVRTLDPSLPTSRALAIAGAVRRGRRRRPRNRACEPGRRRPRRPLRPARLHRLARPLPHLVAGAAAGEARRLHVDRRGARARPRGRDRARSLAARLRLARRRLEPPRRADEGGARRGHRRDADDHDLEGLPLGVAQLRRARGRRRRPRGSTAASSSATRPASRPASCARSRPGGSATATCSRPRTSGSRRRAPGSSSPNSRGVAAIHDKDGWLGAPGIFQRLRDEGNLSAPSLGLDPARPARFGAAALSLRSGFGDEYLRIGYLKCFMDGTLGSQTALLTDGTGVEITTRARARGDHPARRRARLAGRRPRDRRPGEPERARRVRGDA